MTMPHLMNCGHSDDGWCLDCVKAQHAALAAEKQAREAAETTISEREAELLRVRTSEHKAAHALDNIAVEGGLRDRSVLAVQQYVRELKARAADAERRLGVAEAVAKNAQAVLDSYDGQLHTCDDPEDGCAEIWADEVERLRQSLKALAALGPAPTPTTPTH